MSQWYSTLFLYTGIEQDDVGVEFGTKYGDSVIEDNYSDYILTDQVDTVFAYTMFDKSKCLNIWINKHRVCKDYITLSCTFVVKYTQSN